MCRGQLCVCVCVCKGQLCVREGEGISSVRV